MQLGSVRFMGVLFVALSLGGTSIARAADFDKGVAANLSGDYATALQEFRPLAEQGDASAQVLLGGMYMAGDGVPQDFAEAATWYRKAAEQGDVDAQFGLGVMYFLGKGIPQDDIQAHMWLDLAASQGNTRASNALDILAERMTSEQVSEAQTLARKWVSNNRQ